MPVWRSCGAANPIGEITEKDFDICHDSFGYIFGCLLWLSLRFHMVLRLNKVCHEHYDSMVQRMCAGTLSWKQLLIVVSNRFEIGACGCCNEGLKSWHYFGWNTFKKQKLGERNPVGTHCNFLTKVTFGWLSACDCVTHMLFLLFIDLYFFLFYEFM